MRSASASKIGPEQESQKSWTPTLVVKALARSKRLSRIFSDPGQIFAKGKLAYVHFLLEEVVLG
jgi:hypothetical protein